MKTSIESNWGRVCRIGILAVSLFAGLGMAGVAGGCQCYESPDRGWEFSPPGDDADTRPPRDTLPDMPIDSAMDVPPDVPPDVRPDAPPDIIVPEDTREADVFSPPTTVFADSNCGMRTSLVVDSAGTEWIGLHRGSEADCQVGAIDESEVDLVVAHHRRGSSQWVVERIDTQRYLQVLSVTEANRPVIAYPNPLDGQLHAARRRPNGTWRDYSLQTMNTVTTGSGFDTASDEDHYYVSFAGNQSDRVEFFSFNINRPGAGWAKEAPLMRTNPSAALERGLRADLGDSAYLVHQRSGRGSEYGLARYDKSDNRWPQTEYFDTTDLTVHSFTVTDDFELCMSSNITRPGQRAGPLAVTCGTMFDLDRRRWEFRNQPDIKMFPPSSMAVGDDGSLYVAFHVDSTAQLRVAKLPPESDSWRFSTIFDGPTSGVSTDVAPDGRLIVSFFACRDPVRSPGACPVEVVRESPDAL